MVDKPEKDNVKLCDICGIKHAGKLCAVEVSQFIW